MPKYFPKHPILKHLQPALNARHHVSHTYKKEKNCILLYILIFVLSDSKLKDKRLRNCGRHSTSSVLFMVYLTRLSVAQVLRFVNNSSEMRLSTKLRGFTYHNIMRLIYTVVRISICLQHIIKCCGKVHRPSINTIGTTTIPRQAKYV
jgi:hypothetical protein